ncbi:metallophosphoesterase [Clostridium sp. SYSU_GA19001]|uniref:metallophosphoesterase n=1 Tax=Clostridium caldaquaticum TaxID=2940653 RepID=UPI002077534C|nr:metallophosphoesterase [Clostridium caldaquaticum]
MQIAVISDTHRFNYVLNQLLDIVKDTDMIIHLGDNTEDIEFFKGKYNGEIINVRGNCDFGNSAPVERLEIIEGKRVFITHGHRYDVKYDLNSIKYKAQEVQADIVLFGHTHESLVIFEQGIWFVNPGSAALPRDFSKSIALLNIDNKNIDINIKKLK